MGKAINAFKTLQKIWFSTTKFIGNQVSKGRCVDFPICGRFMQVDNSESQKYFFVPHLDFLGSGNF